MRFLSEIVPLLAKLGLLVLPQPVLCVHEYQGLDDVRCHKLLDEYVYGGPRRGAIEASTVHVLKESSTRLFTEAHRRP